MVKSSTLVLGGTAGSGGVIGVGSYSLHLKLEETIDKAFGSDFLSDEENTHEAQWRELYESLRDYKNNEGKLNYGLHEIDTSKGIDEVKLLQAWCKKQRTASYGSLIYRNWDHLFKIRSYCVYPILKRLSTQNKGDSPSGSVKILLPDEDSDYHEEFKRNFKKLLSMNRTDESNGIHWKELGLLEVRVDNWNSEDTGAWELSRWCKRAFRTGWNSDEANLYKLTKYLCTYPIER